MVQLVRQVMKETRAGIFDGNTRSEGKLLSLFEPSTEVIHKGKSGKGEGVICGLALSR
jgi:IS5 family transposase